LLQVSSFALSWLVTTVLFALIYKVLPDANIRWREVWIGAAFTAFLFSIGRLALSAYLAFSSTTSAYGAAGSLVLILLWVYYSAQIILFGAEFTYVYAQRCRTAMELGADDCLDPQPAETTDATQPESEPAGTLSTEVTDEPQRSRQPETAGGGG
jgi:membrane protein